MLALKKLKCNVDKFLHKCVIYFLKIVQLEH